MLHRTFLAKAAAAVVCVLALLSGASPASATNFGPDGSGAFYNDDSTIDFFYSSIIQARWKSASEWSRINSYETTNLNTFVTTTNSPSVDLYVSNGDALGNGAYYQCITSVSSTVCDHGNVVFNAYADYGTQVNYGLACQGSDTLSDSCMAPALTHINACITPCRRNTSARTTLLTSTASIRRSAMPTPSRLGLLAVLALTACGQVNPTVTPAAPAVRPHTLVHPAFGTKIGTVDDLVRSAAAAFTGHVLTETREAPDTDVEGGTTTTFRRLSIRVNDSLLGGLTPGSTVSVRDFGWQTTPSVTDAEMRSVDEVRLAPGDDALLFVRPSARYPDQYEMVTGTGVYRLQGASVERDNREEASDLARQIQGVPADHIKQSVRAAAARKQ